MPAEQGALLCAESAEKATEWVELLQSMVPYTSDGEEDDGGGDAAPAADTSKAASPPKAPAAAPAARNYVLPDTPEAREMRRPVWLTIMDATGVEVRAQSQPSLISHGTVRYRRSF